MSNKIILWFWNLESKQILSTLAAILFRAAHNLMAETASSDFGSSNSRWRIVGKNYKTTTTEKI